MPKLQISEKTYRRLLILKNHWSFTYRNVTNKEVLDKMDALKEEIFGYPHGASMEEIQKISVGKSRSQLEAESERFQNEFNKILKSKLDFEPEYTMDEHLKKLVELIEENQEIGAPIF